MQDRLFHSDFRLLAAMRFEFSIPQEEYVEQRAHLAESAWNTVDICRRHGFHCEALTFPGWTEPHDMLDFGWLHERFPLGSYSTLCVRIKGSPIADSLELTNDQLLGNVNVDVEKIRHELWSGYPNHNNISATARMLDLPEDVAASFQNSPIAACLRDTVEQPRVIDIALLYTKNWSAEAIEDVALDSAVLRMWLSILLNPEKELAIKVV